MTKNKVFLIVQSVFCVLTAIALIVADLTIYSQGRMIKEIDPMADIYTVEAIAYHALWVLPLLAMSVIITIICAISGVRDENADKPVLKIDVGNNTNGAVSVPAINIVRAVVLVLAIAFIVVGIFNGSMSDVFIKASKICTECIGLG